MEIRITRARKIFGGDGKHNAFTGIAAAYGKVFVAFRCGANHMSLDGTVKIIASEDREAWRLAAEVRCPDRDLRDPKLTWFKENLMLFFSGNRAHKDPLSFVVQSSDGAAFGKPLPLRGIPEGQWLWHVRPWAGKLYGTAYFERDGGEAVSLYASEDGLTWEKTCDFPVPGNEVYLDFDLDGVLWALLRDDQRGAIPTLCTAEPPYSQFRSVMRLPMRLKGPMLKRLEGGCVIVCRQWDKPGPRNLRTDLFWLEDDRDIRRVATFPSGGDTSYAGWLDVSEGQAVVSYYSSHEHKMDEPHSNDAAFARDPAHAEHSTAADIFLADVSYA
jgi:hypothetical protein